MAIKILQLMTSALIEANIVDTKLNSSEDNRTGMDMTVCIVPKYSR